MKLIRSLPLRLAPVPGEAIDSWLENVASRLRVPMGELLEVVGLPTTGRAPRAWHSWLTLMLPSELESVATATGFLPEHIRQLTLERFEHRALYLNHDRRQVDRSRIWGRVGGSGSRFCPQCLAENGGRWELSWRLGWSYACLTHRRLLADFCPQCGRRQRERPHARSIIPSPGLCDRFMPSSFEEPPSSRLSLCLHPLSNTATASFEEGHPALQAQRAVLAAIDQGIGNQGVYAQAPLPVTSMLTDMRAIARSILFDMSVGQLAQLIPEALARIHAQALGDITRVRGGSRQEPQDPGRRAPVFAATAAAGITAAWSVLGQPDTVSATHQMRYLIDARQASGHATSPTMTQGWGRHTTPLLEAIHLKAIAPTLWPSVALRYRTASSMPAAPALNKAQACRRDRKVPGMIWPLWAARLDPASRVRVNLATALSAGLLLVNSTIELTTAVDKLGRLIDPTALTHVLRTLRDAPHWDEIQIALIRLAEYLDGHSVPIDYARRRQLDYAGLLPRRDWQQLCSRALFHPGGAARHQAARCMLFEKISGLPFTHLPYVSRHEAQLRAAVARLPFLLTRSVVEELENEGRRFLAQRGIREEPLTWQPPAYLLDGLKLPWPDPALVSPAVLHQHIRSGSSPRKIALALGTDLRTLLRVLEKHPVPAPDLTPEVIRAMSRGGAPTGLDATRKVMPMERLQHLYSQQGWTFVKIARATGCDSSHLATLADEYGIPRRRGHPRGLVEQDWLHEQHVVQGRSLRELAEEKRVSADTMQRWRKVHGIPLRHPLHQPGTQAPEFLDEVPAILRPATNTSAGRRQLRVLLGIAQYPTLRSACDALGLSRSTVTAQIKRLETTFGEPLLVRAQPPSPMKTTRFGDAVIAAASPFAERLGSLRRSARPGTHLST
ncbi:TniQ family protein [Streptomyces zaomyceticus]|uniref:TniQ family protein n=1 Tax=Streptomyces zaomyceticus TaxID=68286 RepID=UPI0036BA60B7